jgi:hypothetical protein
MFYTYLLSWTSYDKHYYGVRYSKRAKIADIGITYLSSSKYVKAFIEKHGMPNVIKIRKIFNDKESALEWERKVLTKLDVEHNERFINRWNGNMVPINLEGPFPFEFSDIQKKVDTTLRSIYGARGSANNSIKEKVYVTNRSRYGTHHTLNTQQVSVARIEAIFNKYGTDNPWKNREVYEQTLLEKHGWSNPMQSVEIRKKHKKAMENKNWSERNEKTKMTNIEKYGISCAMNTKESIEKNSRCCPFFCDENKKYNAGNFSKHMKLKHNWTQEEIKVYKHEN